MLRLCKEKNVTSKKHCIILISKFKFLIIFLKDTVYLRFESNKGYQNIFIYSNKMQLK